LNKFDKGDLKHELKHAGFEECVADDIVERVDDRKMSNWTEVQGRDEAMREIEMFINRAKQAYDNYRQRNMPSAGTMSSPM